jgi:hypothetical protein
MGIGFDVFTHFNDWFYRIVIHTSTHGESHQNGSDRFQLPHIQLLFMGDSVKGP